jgi:GNAT superfamily N-acetyltransferase
MDPFRDSPTALVRAKLPIHAGVVKTRSGPPDTIAATLRDGSVAELRFAELADEGAVLELLRSLSVHSRAMRFSTTAVHLPSAARAAVEHTGVIAFAPDGRCVGHAWFVTTTERRAEVALVIADSYQGRGLGTILLKRLARVAALRAIHVLEGYVLLDNVRMTDLLRHCGFPLRTRPDREGLRFELDIPQPLEHAA